MEAASANPQEFSKVAQVRQQVEEVKSVMMDNIEQVLDRGDRIELLVDKTEELRFQVRQASGAPAFRVSRRAQPRLLKPRRGVCPSRSSGLCVRVCEPAT